MNVEIEISKSLVKQFQRVFKLDNALCLHPSVGTGGPMKYLEFPGEMEFYHFPSTKFAQPIHMKSINPVNSDWFLIHVNLSAAKQHKTFAGQSIDFQKSLPIGMLIYGPGLEIDTLIPPDVDSELASIRFNQSFLSVYFEDWRETLALGKNLILEDLDYQMEADLLKALSAMDDKLRCHAAVLGFLGRVFTKLAGHDKASTADNLRASEIEGLFRACALLRAPLNTDVPSLSELASTAHMGRTKFKAAFKQVFGSPPMQYRNRVRMEFAREQITAQRKTPTEISYLLGYSHPSNFTVAYKKHFGELPSESL